MESLVYLKFDMPGYDREKASPSFLERASIRLLKSIFPLANPDFDDLYMNVKYWCVEFDVEDGPPVRELGFDANDNNIVIGPWETNLGFWTDSNVDLDYCRNTFHPQVIAQSAFEAEWNKFLSDKGHS